MGEYFMTIAELFDDLDIHKGWQDRCHPKGWLCELPHYP